MFTKIKKHFSNSSLLFFTASLLFVGAMAYYVGTQQTRTKDTNLPTQISASPDTLVAETNSPTPTPSAKPTSSAGASATPLASPKPVEKGATLEEIKFTLAPGWESEYRDNGLFIGTPDNTGYFFITTYPYSGAGRREYFCEVTKDRCIPETTFTPTKIGNISGYKADRIDNSGGGPMFFGAKGDTFYLINTYGSEKIYSFLDSLVF